MLHFILGKKKHTLGPLDQDQAHKAVSVEGKPLLHFMSPSAVKESAFPFPCPESLPQQPQEKCSYVFAKS
jgi:hypothetical protein